MNRTLRDFLAAREAEIKAQMADLQREMRELRAARAAVEAADVGARPSAPKTFGGMNQRDMMAAVLDEHPDGGTGPMVAAWVRDQFGVEVAEGSVSPQLSRLRREGRAVLDPDKKKWVSTKHVTAALPADPSTEADGGESQSNAGKLPDDMFE